jgi:hypothetical protein
MIVHQHVNQRQWLQRKSDQVLKCLARPEAAQFAELYADRIDPFKLN